MPTCDALAWAVPEVIDVPGNLADALGRTSNKEKEAALIPWISYEGKGAPIHAVDMEEAKVEAAR